VAVDPSNPNFTQVRGRRRTNVIDPNDRIQLFEDLVVEGTTGNDNITVSHNLQSGTITVNLNGAIRQFGDSALLYVRIEGGLGADSINTTNLFISATVHGGDGNDTINTGSRNDDADGGAGNDTINTGGGNDMARGGTGDDRISGGDGTDRLNGNFGRDTLFGNAGDDYLCGNVPGFADFVPDHLDGGLGRDTAIFRENHDTVASIEQFD
jgi:Ca2+-binding RTX toxin-like protein